MKRKNVLNIVWIFVAMTLLMGVMPSGAFAEELNTELNETDSLTLESIMAINGAKENIFNNLLNSVDFYDAVEGEFTTTLWSNDDTLNTTVSYVSNIPEQESYQKISENGKGADTEVYVTEGKTYTFDNVSRSYTVLDSGIQDVEAEREKKNTNICVSKTEESQSKKTQFVNRVGIKEDGMPVYRYRSDLTNASYAAVSIFPQDLTFGLLTNMDDWDIVDTGKYLGRDTIILHGVVSDPVYSEKINSAEYDLTIDFETGIILEFVGFDAAGTETESIRTHNINIIKNLNTSEENLTDFVSEALNDFNGYIEEKIATPKNIGYNEERNISTATTAATSISCRVN